jgi:hypothetical protein
MAAIHGIFDAISISCLDVREKNQEKKHNFFSLDIEHTLLSHHYSSTWPPEPTFKASSVISESKCFCLNVRQLRHILFNNLAELNKIECHMQLS